MTQSTSRKRWWAVAACLCVPMITFAETPDPSKLFREAEALLSASSAFRVRVEKRFDAVLLDGAKVEYGGAVDLVVRRSDGFHITYGDDLSSKEAWYDGSTMTILDHLDNVYVTAPAEGTVAEALLAARDRYGLRMPFAPLLERNLGNDFEEVLSQARYLGIHDAHGVVSHHLLFRGEDKDLQMWIAAEGEPLLRKMVLTFRDIEGAPQQSTVFYDWDLEARVKARDFKAEIPDGAIQTEFLTRGEAP